MTEARELPLVRWLLWLPVAGVLTLLMAPIRIHHNLLLWRELANASHFPLFALFTIFVFFVLPERGWSVGRRYATTFGIGCATALLTELSQPLVARSGSVVDLVNGLLGVATAIVGVWIWRERRSARATLGHGVATIVIFAAVLGPFWTGLRALPWRAEAFPVLGEFEDPIELRFWAPRHGGAYAKTKLTLSNAHVRQGASSLEVRTPDGTWAGVTYLPGPFDWAPYDALAWELYNPAEPFWLYLRVGDLTSTSDRAIYSRALTAESGWNSFRVPLSEVREASEERNLDLASIHRVVLHTGRNEPGRVYYVDHVRLEP